MKAIRWGDNDKYFGPFTYSKSNRNGFAIELCSGSCDYPGCSLRISVSKITLIAALPPIIKPSRTWVDTSKYEWGNKNGGGYWDIHNRQYGVSYNDGYLSFSLGAQTMDSSTTQHKGYFLPWTQWRHVRTSFYGLQGEHYFTEPRDVKFFTPEYDVIKEQTDNCPTVSFAFLDYDGELLEAKTKIREMEWHFGTGYFKWLRFFRKAKISRSLDITFSGETGKRKGSWKGGTIGHSIEMEKGELHESAFRRYCANHNMIFKTV